MLTLDRIHTVRSPKWPLLPCGHLHVPTEFLGACVCGRRRHTSPEQGAKLNSVGRRWSRPCSGVQPGSGEWREASWLGEEVLPWWQPGAASGTGDEELPRSWRAALGRAAKGCWRVTWSPFFELSGSLTSCFHRRTVGGHSPPTENYFLNWYAES